MKSALSWKREMRGKNKNIILGNKRQKDVKANNVFA